MEINDSKHACVFTGHRPEKLAIPETDVIAWLDKEIREAVDDGYTMKLRSWTKAMVKVKMSWNGISRAAL